MIQYNQNLFTQVKTIKNLSIKDNLCIIVYLERDLLWISEPINTKMYIAEIKSANTVNRLSK